MSKRNGNPSATFSQVPLGTAIPWATGWNDVLAGRPWRETYRNRGYQSNYESGRLYATEALVKGRSPLPWKVNVAAKTGKVRWPQHIMWSIARPSHEADPFPQSPDHQDRRKASA